METDGPEPASATIIGIGVSNKIGTGSYILLRYWDLASQKLVDVFSRDDEKLIVESLMEVLHSKKLIMHNAPFDVCTTYHYYGHYLTDALHADTILMKHTYDENRPHGLKALAKKYQQDLGIPLNEDANAEQIAMKKSIVENGGKMTKAQYDLYKADPELIGYYGAADCDLTLRLFQYLEVKLQEAGSLDFFYRKEVMPLCKTSSIIMKLSGMPIDVPYFENLKVELEADAKRLESKILEEIDEDVQAYENMVIGTKILPKRAGDFAKEGIRHFDLPVPVGKNDKETVAKVPLQKLKEKYNHFFLDWLLWTPESKTVEPFIKPEEVVAIQRRVYEARYGDVGGLFSLSGKSAMTWLIYERWEIPVDAQKRSKKTGKASLDEDVLVSLVDKIPIVKDMLALRKVEKMLSTYLRPILNKQLDGYLYPDMNQSGTTSGRYSCSGGLNLQTLPRDDTRIKKGFIAPKGYKIVNADFASLEPRIFCFMSSDIGLKEIFQKGLDFYSKIAIDVLGAEGMSADPNAENYLKKLKPELRQQVKSFALSVPYGANAYRLHMETGRPLEEHQEEIEAYYEAYPYLRVYMVAQEKMAQSKGYVETQFGRRRHLPMAKVNHGKYSDIIFSRMKMAVRFAGEEGEELYGKFLELTEMSKHLKRSRGKIKEYEEVRAEIDEIKNTLNKLGREGIEIYSKFRSDLNNAKNSPIQMTAAHVANAAAIKYSRSLIEHGIDGYLCLQIHDELCSIIREDQAELAAQLLKEAMEYNWVTKKIDVPILAEPIIADNLAEAK